MGFHSIKANIRTRFNPNALADLEGARVQFLSFSVADLPSAPPPDGPKFSQFHAVFLENLAKSYVGAPPGGLTPILQGILDPPQIFMQFSAKILPNNRFSAQTQGLVPLSGKSWILHCKRASSHSWDWLDEVNSDQWWFWRIRFLLQIWLVSPFCPKKSRTARFCETR